MSKSLNETKETLSRKYLGKGGIHGIGIRRSQNAICIYVNIEDSPGHDQLFDEIKNEAAPYQVLKIQEDSSNIY